MLWPLGVQVGEVAQVLVAVEQQVQVPADLRPESLSFNPQLILSIYFPQFSNTLTFYNLQYLIESVLILSEFEMWQKIFEILKSGK